LHYERKSCSIKNEYYKQTFIQSVMKTSLIAILFLLLARYCFAQDFWVELCLPGNTTLYSMAANSEGKIFAGTHTGIYISSNHGLDWSGTVMTNYAYDMVVDKNDRIFGVFYPNIFYSVNNGSSWNEIICPQVGIEKLYVNDNTLVFGNWGEIYTSHDFGNTWVRTLFLDNTNLITSIIDRGDGILFAGITGFVGGGGVYRSMDNGDTWEQSGLIDDYISSVAVNSNGVLFAGSRGNYFTCLGGVFKSEDMGNTWIKLTEDIWVTSLVIDTNDIIYAGTEVNSGQGGVFRSIDNGQTWEYIHSGMGQYPSVEGMCLAPDGYLYAYDTKLYRSAGPVYSQVYTVNVTPNPPDGGVVSGAGEYNYGQTAQLIATPNVGYRFLNWTDDNGAILSTDSVYSFTVVQDINLMANFHNGVGITLNYLNNLKVEPNPVYDYIKVTAPAKDMALRIIDMTGREVFSQHVLSGEPVHVSLLKPGIYCLIIEVNGQAITRKIVKQ